MATIKSVSQIVESHLVTRTDGQQFVVDILRIKTGEGCGFETYSYTAEVFTRSMGGGKMAMREVTATGTNDLLQLVLAEVEKL